MSQDNVELVRAFLEAFARRDVDSMLALWHTDAEWRPALTPGGMEGNTYVGHEGARRWLAEVAEAWETLDVIDPSFQSVGDRVLVLARVRARGPESGAEIETELAQLWEIEGGKARRATGFMSHAEALEAVGLSQ
jgi:ketosteroid isomerase-like protein